MPPSTYFLSCAFGFGTKLMNFCLRPWVTGFRPLAVVTVGHAFMNVGASWCPWCIDVFCIMEEVILLIQF